MKISIRKFSTSVMLFSVSVGPYNALATSANDKCQAIFFNDGGSQLVYPKDAFVSYNMGILHGVSGTQPGAPKLIPAHDEVEKYNKAGLTGYRVVRDRDAYLLPGAPGTPGRAPNINSDDPRVTVTAQARGNDFMNVTFLGPRNSVLAQILKTSQSPAKDLTQFLEMYPIISARDELPEAIELKIKMDEALRLQTLKESEERSDELKRRTEEVRAREILAEQRVAQLEEGQKQERARQQNAARIREEEIQLAIKERNLSGFEHSVEISVEFDTSSYSFGGSGMGRSMIAKGRESKDIEASIEEIKVGLNGIQSTAITYQLQKTTFLNRPTTKAYKTTLKMKGSRKDVVQLIARGIALFPPAMGDGTARQKLEKVLARLNSAYPPKTPVKKWQDLVIQEASPYFYGEGPDQPYQGYRGGEGAGSPVWSD